MISIQTHCNKFCDKKACLNESEILKGCHWHTARTATINQKILTRISAAQQPAFSTKKLVNFIEYNNNKFRFCDINLATFPFSFPWTVIIFALNIGMRSLSGTFLIVIGCWIRKFSYYLHKKKRTSFRTLATSMYNITTINLL